ncbi:MAG: hypothetical protein LBS59_04515 [Puniceicoccales bacterium]|nr:hypothetical protein [Puniceicoccales bacterium]
MAKEEVTVGINLKSNTVGAKTAGDALGLLKKQAEDTKAQIAGMANQLGSTFSAVKAAFAFNVVDRAFSELSGMFGLESLIERGTRFNEVMLTTKKAIAGVLLMSQPGRFAAMGWMHRFVGHLLLAG